MLTFSYWCIRSVYIKNFNSLSCLLQIFALTCILLLIFIDGGFDVKKPYTEMQENWALFFSLVYFLPLAFCFQRYSKSYITNSHVLLLSLQSIVFTFRNLIDTKYMVYYKVYLLLKIGKHKGENNNHLNTITRDSHLIYFESYSSSLLHMHMRHIFYITLLILCLLFQTDLIGTHSMSLNIFRFFKVLFNGSIWYNYFIWYS